MPGITIAPGPLYHFGDVSVTGLKRLRPSYVTNRFTKLNGKVYSPDLIDEKFRALFDGPSCRMQLDPYDVSRIS